MIRHAPHAITLALLMVLNLHAGEATPLTPPKHKASLVCFNGKADSRSSCRIGLASIDGPSSSTKGALRCGYKGAVSEIRWKYLGRKDGKDRYHFVRRFPIEGAAPDGSIDTPSTKTTEIEVGFDGKRIILFEDKAQCIAIELLPPDLSATKAQAK